MPTQCLTIPLNSTNCDQGDDLITKPIINNINKCELIIEKNNDNIETCIEYKIDSKVPRNEETESVRKKTSREKPPPEKLTNFQEILKNFHDIKNDNNEENRLIVKDVNIENNNSEDNRLRVNGNNTENSNNESTVKSNQGKLAFMLGDSMVKYVNGYLLMGSINRKFIVKVRTFSSAKTINMEDYTKLNKRDFNPNLFILHVGTNDLSLDGTPEVISSRIIDTAESLMIKKTKNNHFKHCPKRR